VDNFLPSPLAETGSIDVFFIWKALKNPYYLSTGSMLYGLLNQILLR
jgi:hypothetical protein